MFTERRLVPRLLVMITAKCSGRGRETDNLVRRNHVPYLRQDWEEIMRMVSRASKTA